MAVVRRVAVVQRAIVLFVVHCVGTAIPHATAADAAAVSSGVCYRRGLRHGRRRGRYFGGVVTAVVRRRRRCDGYDGDGISAVVFIFGLETARCASRSVPIGV